MCAFYVLGLIASVFGFAVFGVSSVETSEAIPAEAPLVASSGGGSVSASGNMEIISFFQGDVFITFPRQVASAERDTMEAQLFGTLMEQDQCLYVTPDTGDIPYLVIWSPEYSISVDNGMPIVVDAAGVEAVRLGQHVYLDGGEIPAEVQPDFEAESGVLPIEGCSGPYWLMGTTARPSE
jgi:hypothetical protein